MAHDQANSTGGDSGAPRRRRPRYSGTHPRRFDHRYKELQPDKYPGIHDHVRSQGRTPAGTHVPVLLNEVLDSLKPKPGDIVVDCTLGYGGHAEAFLKRIAPNGRLIGLDVDAEQLDLTKKRLAEWGDALRTHRGNFAGLAKALDANGLNACDVILADLGVSSMQVDDPARGFSYKQDGPLDMRMDARRPRTAADLIATLPANDLSAALRDLADEPDHKAVADTVVTRRRSRAILRTSELVAIVLEAKGLSRKSQWPRPTERAELHPAARTFQALRILVNDELGALAELLRLAPHCLRAAGRVGIICFHSGEDRLVKRAFAKGFQDGVYDAISDEFIQTASAERHANPRSKSAKFRWARRRDESQALA